MPCNAAVVLVEAGVCDAGFPESGTGAGAGGSGKVKSCEATTAPPGVVSATTRVPVSEPGAVISTSVSLTTVNVAGRDPTVTAVVGVRPVPVKVITVPATPEVGEIDVSVGGVTNV